MIPVQSGRDHTERLELSCDVVVVGSGASGAVVACTMAEAGYDVLVLEEGPFVPYTDYGTMRPSGTSLPMLRTRCRRLSSSCAPTALSVRQTNVPPAVSRRTAW